MAYILQLETSTDVCSVAISASGSTISIVESLEPNSHTEKLTLLIIECLAKVEISIKISTPYVSVTDPDLIPRLEWDHLLQRVFVIH